MARTPTSRPVTLRCRYRAKTGTRCQRIATQQGQLCGQHRRQLEEELAASGHSLIDDVMEGRVSIGDAISGAVTGFTEKLFGENPLLRDMANAARRAQATARARQASGSPPPGASQSPPPRGAPRPPPPPSPSLHQQRAKAREILHFDPGQVLTEPAINDRRKQLAKACHPDRPGGSTEQMKRVNLAADLLLAELANRG